MKDEYFQFLMTILFALMWFFIIFFLPQMMYYKEERKERKNSIPLFSHWKCTNCAHWLTEEEYTSFKKDKGCPICKTSLLNYEWIEVDRKKEYYKTMGFGEEE